MIIGLHDAERDRIADILARVKWIKFIRFSCDQIPQIEAIEHAAARLRSAAYDPTVCLSICLSRRI